MNTYIYFVRHAESDKTEGNERTRGLTDQGKRDCKCIPRALMKEEIDVFFSSPYRRAVMTLEESAMRQGREIRISEDLRELVFSKEEAILPDQEVHEVVQHMFTDPDFALSSGESIRECRERSVASLKQILNSCKGRKIAIGTDGLVMTLMMNAFDCKYGYDFLMRTSKPDIYKLEFDDEVLTSVLRIQVK